MVIEFRKLFKDKIKFMKWYGRVPVNKDIYIKKQKLLQSQDIKECTHNPKLNQRSLKIEVSKPFTPTLCNPNPNTTFKEKEIKQEDFDQ